MFWCFILCLCLFYTEALIIEFYEQLVAVLKLNLSGLQRNQEFIVEVLMLSLLRHSNLVTLTGYCTDGDQRLLVYEYIPQGSQENHLFGNSLIISFYHYLRGLCHICACIIRKRCKLYTILYSKEKFLFKFILEKVCYSSSLAPLSITIKANLQWLVYFYFVLEL